MDPLAQANPANDPVVLCKIADSVKYTLALPLAQIAKGVIVDFCSRRQATSDAYERLLQLLDVLQKAGISTPKVQHIVNQLNDSLLVIPRVIWPKPIAGLTPRDTTYENRYQLAHVWDATAEWLKRYLLVDRDHALKEENFAIATRCRSLRARILEQGGPTAHNRLEQLDQELDWASIDQETSIRPVEPVTPPRLHKGFNDRVLLSANLKSMCDWGAQCNSTKCEIHSRTELLVLVCNYCGVDYSPTVMHEDECPQNPFPPKCMFCAEIFRNVWDMIPHMKNCRSGP